MDALTDTMDKETNKRMNGWTDRHWTKVCLFTRLLDGI